MKRIWKYLLLVIVLLVVSIGGYGLYIFKFKEYDVADPEIEEIIGETYILKLPDGTQVVVDKDGNIIEEVKNSPYEQSDANGVDENTNTGANGSTPSINDSNSPREGTVQNDKPTVSSIKAKYMPTLRELEAQANNNINALIGRAINEYSTKKANGEKIDVGYFYNKYVSAAKALEANTDAAFNSLITIIENELEANGFDKAHAQSIRDEYEAAKEERRNSLLKKAKEFL